MDIQPTTEQLVHKISYNCDQAKAEMIIKAAVEIAKVAFDSSVAGWVEETLPNIIRSYVVSQWEQSDSTDPKEIAVLAIKVIQKEFTDQLNDAIDILE